MYKKSLLKPDGRSLWLYSRRPIADGFTAPSPASGPTAPSPHLRWHPLRGEWVAYAGHRQHRTFLPPAEFNPLAPTLDPSQPTELPAGDYDVAVFENLFPAFASTAHDNPQLIVEAQPAVGACEVVVFTQDPSQHLATLPVDHLDLILEVLGERYRELGERAPIQYVMPFENRGVEVGVTLHHPHGQIYAYPFVPPIPQRELELQHEYYASRGRGLLEDLIEREVEADARVLYCSEQAVAFVPVCARYSYEVWVAPRRPTASVLALSTSERREFARALKTVLLKFDRLWSKPFPYVMVFHQAPTDGRPHPHAHLHIELYPPYRMRGRLKYLAGSELGAGVFTADSFAEDTAAELRAVEVTVD